MKNCNVEFIDGKVVQFELNDKQYEELIAWFNNNDNSKYKISFVKDAKPEKYYYEYYLRKSAIKYIYYLESLKQ